MKITLAGATGLASALTCCRISRPPVIRFTAAETFSSATQVGTAPMFAVSSTGSEAIAWVSAPGGGTDGRLYVSVDRAPPVELRDSLGPIEGHGESPPKLAYGANGTLNALYVVARVEPGKRFPIAALRFTHSADGGRHWSMPMTVTDDRTFGAHNFHALHAAADGSLYVAWLDGRMGKSAAYLARSHDGGDTWDVNRRVAEGEACPCCRTALATAADGTVFVAWREVFAGDVRDVVVARSSDHGHSWTEPVRVHADNWVFAGCPHAGPSLQVDQTGRLHIAWWTGKEGAAGVYYAHSDDQGEHFSAPVALGTAAFSQPSHAQVALEPAGGVAVAWDDGTVPVSRILVRVSRDSGRTFAAPIAVSAEGRVAGFPVLALRDTTVIVAWSEESPEAAAREASMRPNMKDPKAVMGLHAVGEAQVLVRRGRLRGGE